MNFMSSRQISKSNWRTDLMEDLRSQGDIMSDVIIACSDGNVSCKNVFLAALSPFYSGMLRDILIWDICLAPAGEPSVIMMPDISADNMKIFLNSVYRGLPEDRASLEAVKDVYRILCCKTNFGPRVQEEKPDEEDLSSSLKVEHRERLKKTAANLDTSCFFCSESVNSHKVSLKVKQEKNNGCHQKLQYVCCQCGHAAKTPSKFLSHINVEKLKFSDKSPPNIWQFDCPLCSKPINKHQTESEGWICCHCKDNFESPGMLSLHLKTVLKMEKGHFQSEPNSGGAIICEKQFKPCEDCILYKSKKEKMDHYKENHHNHYNKLLKKNLEYWKMAPSSRYIECDLCSMNIRKCNLKSHKRNIHRVNLDNQAVPNENPADRICDICGHVSAYAKDVKKHKKSVHAKVFSFTCKFCNKKFSNKGNLNQHEVAHTGITPYQCHQCGNQFRRRAQLAKHIESHSQDGGHLPEPAADVAAQLPVCVPGTVWPQPGMLKDLAVQAPSLKMPAFIIHS